MNGGRTIATDWKWIRAILVDMQNQSDADVVQPLIFYSVKVFSSFAVYVSSRYVRLALRFLTE